MPKKQQKQSVIKINCDLCGVSLILTPHDISLHCGEIKLFIYKLLQK